jgi:WD40 repeat protein
MKGATSICTIIIVTLLLLASAKAPAQPASTNQPSSLVTLTCIPPVEMVNSILISPDGKMIATLRGEGTSWNQGGKPLNLEIWSVSKGTLLWKAKERAFYLCAFSPDGKRLVGIAADTSVLLWDAVNGTVKARFRWKTSPVSMATFLSDGRTLVTAAVWPTGTSLPGAGEIQLWNAKSGRSIRALKAQTNAISALAVSPDERTVAVANQANGTANSVNILDVTTDSVRYTLTLGTNVFMIHSMAFSSDGKTLAAGSGTFDGKGEVRLWDVASGKLRSIVTEADVWKGAPLSMEPFVAFSPDGELLAIAGDHQSLTLWNVPNNKWQTGGLGVGDPPEVGRYLIQFVPNGLLLAGVNRFQQVEVKSLNYKGE